MLAMKNPQAEKVPFSHLGACGVDAIYQLLRFSWSAGLMGNMD